MFKLQADVTKYFPELLEIFFSNDVNVKIRVDALLDEFSGNCIVFLFFPSLGYGNKLGLQAIYDVPNLFFSSMTYIKSVY